MAEVTGMTPEKITQEINNVKSYVDGGLSEKADITQVNSGLSKKADTTQVTSELSKKADTTQVTSELSKKADTTYVDSELSKKADTTQVSSNLSKKADTTYVDSELSKKADTTQVTSDLLNKADITQVNLGLSKKADTTYVDSELSKKADTTYVDSELSKKVDTTQVTSDLSKKADTTYVDSAKWLQPPVSAGTDLDTLTTPCVRVLPNGEQPNKPFSGTGVIEILPIVGGGTLQRATSHNPLRVWKRRTVADTFGSWSVEPTNSDLDSKADKSYVDSKADKSYVDSVNWVQPRVPAGTDLDTLTTPCVRVLPSGVQPNKPFSGHGFIEVMPVISGGTLQRATDYDNLKVWTRKTAGGVFQAWEEGNPTWLRPYVASGTDLNTITSPGVRLLLFSSQPNKPFSGAGVLEVFPIVGGGTLQRITDYATLEVWKRKTLGGVFQPWVKEPTNETVTQTITETIDNNPALTQDWTKTYPLMVTTGAGASNFSPFGDYRVRIQFTAPILRWRLHISTVHPYSSTHKSAADLSDVRIGLGLGDGEMEDGEVLLGTNTTIEEGGEWVSDWSRYDLRQDSLLALTVSRHGTYYDCLLAGWVKQNGTWVRKQHIPIWIWIEAETYSATPSVALIGDSTGSGQGSIEPVWDSAVAIAGRKQEFLPVLYAASGDNLANYTNPDRIILKRWEHFARADSVVIQSGSNDIHGGGSLEKVKTSFEKVQPIARKLGVKVYAATIKPRYPAGNMEDVRIPYNEWLKTLPFGIDGVIDYDGAVAPDGAILPEDNADGAHLTKSGQMKLASAYSYPIARPRVTETWKP